MSRVLTLMILGSPKQIEPHVVELPHYLNITHSTSQYASATKGHMGKEPFPFNHLKWIHLHYV